jgi:divalent metal cation (Fe/Co/Zn/Cd) transporter
MTQNSAAPHYLPFMATAVTLEARRDLVRRGQRLSVATLLYNTVEAIVAIAAGLVAGSIALVSFGIDSGIELAASVTALWRLNADADDLRRERVERASHRLIGALFMALAVYIVWEASSALWSREVPRSSPVGIGLAMASVVVMPLLARAKKRVGAALDSRALESESMQTALCAYLSAILLAGLVLNAAFGWYWADPAAALAMVPIIAREGLEGLRARPPCADDCHA